MIRMLGFFAVIGAAVGMMVAMRIHFATDSDISLALTGAFLGMFLVGGNWLLFSSFGKGKKRRPQEKA
jgi:hypothetical protein